MEISAGLNMRGIEDAAFADLSGSGSLDSVVSSAEGRAQRLAVHESLGPLLDAGSWRVTELVPGRPEMYMKARAANLSPNSSYVVAGSREGGDHEPALFLFRRDAEGWHREQLAAVDFKTTGLKLVDIDGDGWRDVLFAGRSELAWLRNPGTDGRDWRRQTIARGVSEFAVCDLDKDGRLDVVAGTSRHSDLVARWFRRSATGNSSPWESWPITTAIGRPGGDGNIAIKGVACGDLDNDGDVDLAFTSSGAGHGVFSLTNTGNPASNAHWSLHYHVGHMDSMKYDNLELADLDRDGDLDIVTSEEGEGVLSPGLGVTWLENPTARRLRG
ncbi:MAG: VCBS repeat-containing protein [Halioglobus sp.]|nr:VCBS repeat-containing protein [Halioglobus sp.]